MVVERRDFKVATNSLVCSTGFAVRVTISTGIGGMPPPGALAPACPSLPPHAAVRHVAAISEQNTKARRKFGEGWAVDIAELIGVFRTQKRDGGKANPYYIHKS